MRNPHDPYAEWASTYPPRPHNALMEIEQETVLALLPPIAGRVVLDAGCGTGRYAIRLREMGASRVVACDRSAAMLAHAEGPCLARADFDALPVKSASMDVVVCGLALNDVEDLPLTVGELARVLRPGGSLVASLLHPRGAAEGWRRSFDTRDGTREVPAQWHSVDDLRRACERAGLSMTDIREPGLEQGTPGVPRHKRPRRGSAQGGQPVALVFRAVRDAQIIVHGEANPSAIAEAMADKLGAPDRS